MRERDKRTATEHLGADVLSAKKKNSGKPLVGRLG